MEHQEKRKLWTERVEEFLASGQSRRAWCEERDLSAPQLGYWLGKFKKETQKATDHPNHWVGLDSPGTGVYLRIGELVVEVEEGFNRQLLADIVHTLMTLC